VRRKRYLKILDTYLEKSLIKILLGMKKELGKAPLLGF